MGDNSRSHSHDLFHIVGFGNFGKACKSFLTKCYPEKNLLFFKKSGNKTKNVKPNEEDVVKSKRFGSHQKSKKRNSDRDAAQGVPEPLQTGWDPVKDPSRSPQWSPHVSPSTGPTPKLSRHCSHGISSFSRSTSKKSALFRSRSQSNSMDGLPPGGFGRTLSRTGSTTILYSNSNGVAKPPPVEKKLECTLEELCFGCVKKMNVTRDAATDNGQIVEHDETLYIKVKPGWRKGTKITFDGTGNEIPGSYPADVIFEVAEEEHPLYRWQEDDLRLEFEIPLVEALTGCNPSIPLLGGEKLSLRFEDVVYPGYEEIIAEQGMPKQHDPETRGNLIVTFAVKFPETLTEEQRSSAADILHHTS